MIESIVYIITLAVVLMMCVTFIVHLFFMVPFVPSSNKVTRKMIEVAELQDGQNVFDLGCGDGRILIAAKRAKNVQTIGYELAPMVYWLALLRTKLARTQSKIHFKSFYNAKLENADVVFCYLFPEVMEKLREKFFTECKPGTRIISHTFRMHGIEPTRTIPRDIKTGMPSIYVYTI